MRWNKSTLTMSVPEAQGLAFFASREAAIPLNLKDQGAAQGQELILDFEPTSVSLGARGVLEVQTAQGTTWYHISP
jgi:hypothetical protein